MVNPVLYSETNSLTKIAAIQCLEEYAAKLKWKKSGETIIDLGCGDGSVTCIMKQYIPNNYEKFVACDIHEQAIEYAKERYANENITFRTLDIAGDMPEELKCGFSHVFSFFLLHWVHDQEKAFKNIYELMSPGSECLLVIAGYNPVTYFYDAFARDRNSSKDGSFHDSVPTLYMYMENVDNYLTDLIKGTGFTDINVQLKKRTFNFKNVATLKQFVKGVEAYKIPDDLFDNFFQKFITTGIEKGLYFEEKVTDTNDLNKEVRFEYETFIIQACKPNY